MVLGLGAFKEDRNVTSYYFDLMTIYSSVLLGIYGYKIDPSICPQSQSLGVI
jgi:hypothetical protein